MKKRIISTFLLVAILVSVLSVGAAAASGTWKRNSTGWWYQNSDGSYPAGKWQKIDGVNYYFNNRGYMVTGWQKLGGDWYYFKSSGAMATGWQKVSGTWYYLDSSGVMQTGWLKSGGTWYYLKSSGAMATGWQRIGGSWYFFSGSGAMQTGWLKSGGTWYYLKSSGVMAENETLTISGTKYAFDRNGHYRLAGISESEALKIATNYLGFESGDIDPYSGNRMSVAVSGETVYRNRNCYQIWIRWLIGGHYSTVGFIYVDKETGSVYT